ncbi:hypothetical protein BD410DRAFT_786646 [Rickenella mellea]|uniref:Uncharacterized protein n=1 Tax=Rickenella mellea TaxID=50990 RepID=A0A4Y7Q8G0_9AGAM|nr:hypothetical protein BD410DRAFT_786646 [Rickenella mellea]
MSDSAEDLSYLFLILYDPNSHIPLNILPTDEKFNQEHVATLLGLATKYQIDTLRKRMITHLEAYWPSSLDEWSKLKLLYGNAKRWRFRLEPVQAINLARAYDIPTILPTAYYFLSTINPGYDWEVWVKLHSQAPCMAAAARWNSLTKQDLMCLLLGRPKNQRPYYAEQCFH